MISQLLTLIILILGYNYNLSLVRRPMTTHSHSHSHIHQGYAQVDNSGNNVKRVLMSKIWTMLKLYFVALYLCIVVITVLIF